MASSTQRIGANHLHHSVLGRTPDGMRLIGSAAGRRCCRCRLSCRPMASPLMRTRPHSGESVLVASTTPCSTSGLSRSSVAMSDQVRKTAQAGSGANVSRYQRGTYCSLLPLVASFVCGDISLPDFHGETQPQGAGGDRDLAARYSTAVGRQTLRLPVAGHVRRAAPSGHCAAVTSPLPVPAGSADTGSAKRSLFASSGDGGPTGCWTSR